MKTTDLYVNLFDLIAPLAKTIDMMSSDVSNHHLQVAYLASKVAEEMDFSLDERRDIAVAGILHDIGGFSLQERTDLLEFEETKPHQHAEAGYLLLQSFEPFEGAAQLVRYHHYPWRDGAGARSNGDPVLRGSHVLHLVDRVAVLFDRERSVLGQVDAICKTIHDQAGPVFVPEQVETLCGLAKQDYVWLDATTDSLEPILRKCVAPYIHNLNVDQLLEFSKLLCRIIDFKSEFTATHSTGVAASAVELAQRVGFSPHECKMIEIAAYLHDLGKLAIPSEILEKPAKLTEDEWHIMRTHVYYTYQILEPIEALNTIASWGALHQERLNGRGYPFACGAEELPLGARIMAVADVFTGITEDRPYRAGMSKEEALRVFDRSLEDGDLDPNVVGVLKDSYDAINTRRADAQRGAVEQYVSFRAALTQAAERLS
ncbi:MAG: HD domain-containing protein [bacterium]|nr:HD domain-containing protein [bacterium]